MRAEPGIDREDDFQGMKCRVGIFQRLAAAVAVIVMVVPAVGMERGPDARFTLHLGGITFDPLVERPVFPETLRHVPGTGPDLRIVQFKGPTRDAWLDELRSLGLEVVQYIHPHAYVTWGEAAAMENARSLQTVRWAGDFSPACRLLPHLRSLGPDEIDIRMLAIHAAGMDQIVRSLHDLGIKSVHRRRLDSVFEVLACSVPGDRLSEIALMPGIYTVQPVPAGGGLRGEMADQVDADNFNGNSLSPGYVDWLHSLDFTGEGVILASVDGGIYEGHPDLASRMTGCEGESCGDDVASTHGTLVAGAMAADGTSGVQDPWNFLAGLGVAPGASILEQLYDPIYSEPGGMLLLMRDSQANGAVLSSNSWGPSPVPLGYDLDTRFVDQGVRDSDIETQGNQPLGYVLSIMNGNGGYQTQGTPDEALNIVSVGATRLRTAGGNLTNQYNDVSSVSAHGPCLDGRLLPDIVAPGCYILSTYNESNWSYACGTSMAAPQVAGALGLFTEYYRERISFGRDPSPALSKAALLVAALDLEGNDDADGDNLGHVPDSKQGWGRLQLPGLMNPTPGSMRYVDQTVAFGETGDSWSLAVTPQDSSLPMKIMLVWTTAPGHGLGGETPAWTNDLDLVVDAGPLSYAGNAFDPATGWSTPGSGPDSMNNVEGVYLGPSSPGSVVIRVEAANIVADGIPNYGDGTDQDFALVCFNCESDPFTIAISPPLQEGCSPSILQATVEVNETGGGSNPVTLDVTGDPGVVYELADHVLIPPDTTTLTMTVPSGAGGTFQFAVNGSGSGFETSVPGELLIVNSIASPPDLLQPGEGDVDIPIVPTLAWTAVEGATSYEVEIAEDIDFTSIIYSESEPSTIHAVKQSLPFEQTVFWRVRSLNACGTGSWSTASSFTTSVGVVVLFVDDDDNAPDIRWYYTDALDALGVEYDVWDTMNSDDEPDLQTLGGYDLVIWASGHEYGGYAGPGTDGEAALAAWLDQGGTLWLSSQDYLYDNGLTSFGSTYLGIADYDSDTGQAFVTGVTPPFDTIPTTTLSCPFDDYSDRLVPKAAASVAFDGNEGVTAIMLESENWRTTFWGFPFEAFPDETLRKQILASIIEWIPHAPACPSDIDEDGEVGITDLLEVLSQWGNPGTADVDGNGVVDVMDLLMIVSEWGSCP